MTLNGTVKKVVAAVSVAGILGGGAVAYASRLAKAADVERAFKDIHQGLQDLQLGQLQTARALLSRELFDYQIRDHRLTDLERQRANTVREELNSLDRRIETLKKVQDAR